MIKKQCNDYGLKCLKCPYWNHWTNFCTKWKITTSTSNDWMTEKRFEVVMNEFDEVEYIMDKEMMEDRDFVDFMDFVEDVCKENEQLKQFYEKVFSLLDKEITRNEEVIEWGKEVKANSGSIGFYNYMLKKIKKELQE